MYRLLELNPQLQDFAWDIDYRMQLYRDTKARLLPHGGELNDFASAHNYFGIHHVDGGWVYREWAPNAHQLYLTGDFNNWNWTEYPMLRYGDGCWVLFLEGDNALWEGCKVKTIVDANFTRTEHIPLYARRVVQDVDTTAWCAEVVDDRKEFDWTDEGFEGEKSLYIYEAHVGMAQEHGHVGTYREFADYTLPRIKEAGYNTVQLMAIMEHPYYGSFGYQVSNFYAPSGWFGAPDDLRRLINRAHELGLRVLLDVVHSHACPNPGEGLNQQDGTVIAHWKFDTGTTTDRFSVWWEYWNTTTSSWVLYESSTSSEHYEHYKSGDWFQSVWTPDDAPTSTKVRCYVRPYATKDSKGNYRWKSGGAYSNSIQNPKWVNLHTEFMQPPDLDLEYYQGSIYRITWDTAPALASHIIVYSEANGSGKFNKFKTYSTSSANPPALSLSNGKKYRFRACWTADAKGKSTGNLSLPTVTYYGRPNAPTDFTCKLVSCNATSGSVKLSWKDSGYSGNGYTVEAYDKDLYNSTTTLTIN